MESRPRPDFVMVGGQFINGKVYLLASKTLTDVELREELELDSLRDYRRHPELFAPSYRRFVTAEMKDWIQVIADSYPEAFRTLFEQWAPTGQSEIENRQGIAGG